MGVSINAHVYKIDRLSSDIDAWVNDNGGYREGTVGILDFLEQVCPHFGLLIDDKFIVVWNEYYDEYNPCSNFLNTVTKYFFPEGVDDGFWTDEYDELPGGVDIDLADIFGEDFAYGGKFYPDTDY